MKKHARATFYRLKNSLLGISGLIKAVRRGFRRRVSCAVVNVISASRGERISGSRGPTFTARLTLGGHNSLRGIGDFPPRLTESDGKNWSSLSVVKPLTPRFAGALHPCHRPSETHWGDFHRTLPQHVARVLCAHCAHIRPRDAGRSTRPMAPPGAGALPSFGATGCDRATAAIACSDGDPRIVNRNPASREIEEARSHPLAPPGALTKVAPFRGSLRFGMGRLADRCGDSARICTGWAQSLSPGAQRLPSAKVYSLGAR
jgi:hypothetical protein